jgi:hypothetical protein
MTSLNCRKLTILRKILSKLLIDRWSATKQYQGKFFFLFGLILVGNRLMKLTLGWRLALKI